MSVNIYDKTNDELKLVAGGTLYADSPVGSIVPYGGTTAPKGWLLCQGQAVSRNTYAELFEVIGTAFGTGNGSTTFNVPDLRETAPVGSGTRGDGVASHDTYTVGQFKDDQLQNHTHTTASTGSFSQKYTASAGDMGAGDILTLTGRWDSSATNPYTVTKAISVSGTSGNPTTGRHGAVTRGKRLGVNYIIKAKQIGVPADIENNINEAVKDSNAYTNRYINNVRAFITSSQTISFTSSFTGLLKVYAHKMGSGNTIRLKVNNIEIDQFSCFSTDSSGADLPWITTGNGLDAVLSAHIKKGDSILIDSDRSVAASVNSWYVYSYLIQYNSFAQ